MACAARESVTETWPKLLLPSLVACALMTPATALSESKRGPFHVEAHVVGVAIGVGDPPGEPTYPFEVSAGYHVMGSHEGFVVGLVQRVDVGFSGGALGSTATRVGWDFAIPLGKRELFIAPYAQGGVTYAFEAGDPLGLFASGIEGRFFPFETFEQERKQGRAPVRTERVSVSADRIVIEEKIQFRANEAVIEAVSFTLLDEIASVIKQSPQIRKIEIQGHASSEGDEKRNQALSDERAAAVRTYLTDKAGIAAGRLGSKGFGSSMPLSDNESEEGRERNRRVEFNIVDQDRTVDRVVTEEVARSPAEGFFAVLKPFELDLAIGSEVVPALSFQAGAGWAF